MKTEMETAARDVEQTVQQEIHSASQAFDQTWADVSGRGDALTNSDADSGLGFTPVYQPPKKNWRLKRGATPQWYKQRQGVRRHAQSGAARVARFRPSRSSARRFP